MKTSRVGIRDRQLAELGADAAIVLSKKIAAASFPNCSLGRSAERADNQGAALNRTKISIVVASP
jgi:hypothetical protein